MKNAFNDLTITMRTMFWLNFNRANFCSRYLHVFQMEIKQWRIQDFPEEGAPTPQGGRQHTIFPNFSKNCMKSKEFGPGGGEGGASLAPRPLRSATVKIDLGTNDHILKCTSEVFYVTFLILFSPKSSPDVTSTEP